MFHILDRYSKKRKKKSVADQRSAQWHEGTDQNAYIHRAWMRRGLPANAFDGRRRIAIACDYTILDVRNRALSIDVPQDELGQRRPNQAAIAGFPAPTRGREKLYFDHVMRADTGADLDFRPGFSVPEVSRESH